MIFSLILRILHNQKYSKSLSLLPCWKPVSLTQKMKNNKQKQTHNQLIEKFNNNQLYLKY
jgi:hypothetical protein